MTCSRSIRADIVLYARNGLLIAGLYFFGAASAQTEIHKCTDADGGIVFSQLPCPPEVPAEPDVVSSDEESGNTTTESTEFELPEYDEPQQSTRSEAERAACQKPIRDAIDAIDAEIGLEYTPQKADQYKERLLELTRQLRQC